MELSVALGPTASDFQAELHAIYVCATHLSRVGTSGQHLSIYSDSQASIKALANPLCTSQTVLDWKNVLNELGRSNTINLIWIPGHSDLQGNEEADRLANIGSATTIDDTTPPLCLGVFYSNQIIDTWINNRISGNWNIQPGLALSKRFINTKTHNKVMNWNRLSIKQFIGYLTGHHVTKEYLCRIGVSTDNSCRLCSSHIESSEHILCNCPGLDSLRFLCLGKPILYDIDIKSATAKNLLRFIKKAEERLGPLS